MEHRTSDVGTTLEQLSNLPGLGELLSWAPQAQGKAQATGAGSPLLPWGEMGSALTVQGNLEPDPLEGDHFVSSRGAGASREKHEPVVLQV